MSDDAGAARQTHLRRIALGQRLGRFAKWYFLAVGFLGLLSCVISLLAGRGPSIDLSILIFPAVAAGLWKFHNSARITAIVICAVYIAAGLVTIGWAAIWGTEGFDLTVFGKEYQNASLIAVTLTALGFLVLFAVPLGVLLHPAARHTFQAKTRLRKMRLEPLKWD